MNPWLRRQARLHQAPPAPSISSERLIGRFGAIATVLTAIAGSTAALWTQIQPEIRWGVIGLAGVALLFVAVGKVVMPAIEARRRRRVIAIPDERLRQPTTFRLRPYDEGDHQTFERPDQAHHEALRWLEAAREPFLYLTGFSGTGKSSLLQAWLVPELARADPKTLTLVVRSYADPGAQLTEALAKEGVIADAGAPGRRRPARPPGTRRGHGPPGAAADRDRPVRGSPDPPGRRRAGAARGVIPRARRAADSPGSPSFSSCAPTTSTSTS